MIDRWRGLGMLFGAGLPTAGPIGVQLLRRAPPPDALLTHALQLAPDDPRPVAPILLEIVERYSPKLAWDAYQVLLRGWPADELADLIHAWQDLRAGVGGAADRVKACGVDPCVVTDVPVAFDDAPQLTVDRPWPTQPTGWAVPALRVTVRGVAAPVRLRLRAGWAIAGAEDVGGQIVDVVIAGEARVVVPLPAVAPGRTVSGTWIELLSADGRSRRL